MNVYDFDKTIFYPDCTFLFVRWSLARHPKLLLSYVPAFVFNAVRYALKGIDRDTAEEKLFSFITGIDDIDQEVLDFWDANQDRISPWYLKQKRSDDLIISASPEFLLKPMADRLGVRMLATQMDKKTAKIIGYSCYGRQKVRKALIHQYYPEHNIDQFYSDSLADTPLALCADQAFLVKNKALEPVPWPELTAKQKKKIMKKLSEDNVQKTPV